MRNKISLLIGLLAAVFLLISPKISYAQRGGHHENHHYYRYHDHPRWGLRISWLPSNFSTIRLSGARYYYYDGLFYSRFDGEYVVVAPPVGAVVHSIPRDYRPVVIRGVTYYEDNGTYYVYTRKGFEVVLPPAQFVEPTVISSSTDRTAPIQINALPNDTDSNESFTVNIPNAQGGYTAVLLKRTEKGFVGPQGELYPQFPKVSQLKAMYSR